MPRRRRPVPVSLPLAEPVALADAIAVLVDLETGWEGGMLEMDVERKELRVLAFGRKPQAALELGVGS